MNISLFRQYHFLSGCSNKCWVPVPSTPFVVKATLSSWAFGTLSDKYEAVNARKHFQSRAEMIVQFLPCFCLFNKLTINIGEKLQTLIYHGAVL